MKNYSPILGKNHAMKAMLTKSSRQDTQTLTRLNSHKDGGQMKTSLRRYLTLSYAKRIIAISYWLIAVSERLLTDMQRRLERAGEKSVICASDLDVLRDYNTSCRQKHRARLD